MVFGFMDFREEYREPGLKKSRVHRFQAPQKRLIQHAHVVHGYNYVMQV